MPWRSVWQKPCGATRRSAGSESERADAPLLCRVLLIDFSLLGRIPQYSHHNPRPAHFHILDGSRSLRFDDPRFAGHGVENDDAPAGRHHLVALVELLRRLLRRFRRSFLRLLNVPDLLFNGLHALRSRSPNPPRLSRRRWLFSPHGYWRCGHQQSADCQNASRMLQQ
jgi:hypothetical protein